jgi:purine nucleoside permease
LSDSTEAKAYRAHYKGLEIAGSKPPSVVKCDAATSDVYYSGNLLGEAFENTTKLFTNGSGIYCSTAQEDNATLEALLRGASKGLIDFARIIVMRTASDFDRPYAGEDAQYNLLYAPQGGFPIAIENIYNAGIEVVLGVVGNWAHTFEKGIKPKNYIGDIFGTLGGTPDFGPASGPEGEATLCAGDGDLCGRSLRPRNKAEKFARYINKNKGAMRA